jgi:hypothetical protein
MAKANYDLPNNKIEAVMKMTGSKSKREALIKAIDAFLDQKKREVLINSFGKFSLSWTRKGLQNYRK